MAIEVSMKMTPKQAGAMYMKYEALKEQVKNLEAQLVEKEKLIREDSVVSDYRKHVTTLEAQLARCVDALELIKLSHTDTEGHMKGAYPSTVKLCSDALEALRKEQQDE